MAEIGDHNLCAEYTDKQFDALLLKMHEQKLAPFKMVTYIMNNVNNVSKEIFNEGLINEARHPLEYDFPFVVKGMRSMEQYKQDQMLVL